MSFPLRVFMDDIALWMIFKRGTCSPVMKSLVWYLYLPRGIDVHESMKRESVTMGIIECSLQRHSHGCDCFDALWKKKKACLSRDHWFNYYYLPTGFSLTNR